MEQPKRLSSRHFKDAKLVVGIGNIEKVDPDLLRLGMRFIGAWSYVEATMSQLAAHMMTADHRIVSKMLIAIRSPASRMAAIAACAKASGVHADTGSLLKKALKEAEKTRKVRDKFAHHLWAHSPSAPDSLILLEPGEMARVEEAVADLTMTELKTPGKLSKKSLDTLVHAFEKSVAEARAAYVYPRKMVEHLIKRANRDHRVMMNLAWACRSSELVGIVLRRHISKELESL